MGLQKNGCKGMEWINLTQESMKGSFEYGNEPSGSIKHGKWLTN
jgi:hypothetical protein